MTLSYAKNPRETLRLGALAVKLSKLFKLVKLFKTAPTSLMAQPYFEDVHFDREDFTVKALAKGDYEGCRFTGCNFMGGDLSGFRFTDCRFEDCNLSGVKLIQTTFQDVDCLGCKMMGLHFEQCSEFLFTMRFERCTLQLSGFYQRKLKKGQFKACGLQEVDFTEADLTEADFSGSDLRGAVFERTTLEKADFRTAVNFSINPSINKMKKAKFSRQSLSGLLEQYDLTIE